MRRLLAAVLACLFPLAAFAAMEYGTGSGGGGGGTPGGTPTAVQTNGGGGTFAGNASEFAATLYASTATVTIDTGTVFRGAALTIRAPGSGLPNISLTAPTNVDALIDANRGFGDNGESAFRASDNARSNIWDMGLPSGGVTNWGLTYNGSSQFMTVKPNGNVGFGTSATNPSDPFDIIMHTGGQYVGIQNTAGTSGIHFDVPSGSGAQFNYSESGGSTLWQMAKSGDSPSNYYLFNNITGHIDSVMRGPDDTFSLYGGLYAGSAQSATTGAALNASALLQADSTSKGFLEPRMTNSQRNAIGSPASGLQIYNTDTTQLNYYNGTAWLALSTATVINGGGGIASSSQTVITAQNVTASVPFPTPCVSSVTVTADGINPVMLYGTLAMGLSAGFEGVANVAQDGVLLFAQGFGPSAPGATGGNGSFDYAFSVLTPFVPSKGTHTYCLQIAGNGATVALIQSAGAYQSTWGGYLLTASTQTVPIGPASGDLGGTYPSPTVVSVADVTTGVLPVANGGTSTSTAFTPGSIVFATTGGQYTQDNPNLFYSSSTVSLGLGTNSTGGQILTVKGGHRSNGIGQSINLNSGNATSGNGGDFDVVTGNGASAGNGTGGTFNMTSGNGAGTGLGGSFNLTAGNGGSGGGNGGGVTFQGGNAGGSGTTGGSVVFQLGVGAMANQTGLFNLVDSNFNIFQETNGPNGRTVFGFNPPLNHLSMLEVAGNMAIGSYGGTITAPANGLIVSGNVGISTGAPQGTLHVVGTGVFQSTASPSPGSFTLSVSSTNATMMMAVNGNGHQEYSGTAPTITSCGATPSGSVVGNDNVGVITIGGGVVTACTLNFASNWTNAPVCVISDNSTAVTSDISAVSTSAATFSFSASLGGGVVYYRCTGYR